MRPDSNSQDADANFSYNGTLRLYIVEISIPLGMSDPEDLQSVAGDLIGLAVGIRQNGMPDLFEYPNNTWNNYETLTFQLASYSDSEIGTPFTLILSLLTITSIVIVTFYRNLKFPKKESAPLFTF